MGCRDGRGPGCEYFWHVHPSLEGTHKRVVQALLRSVDFGYTQNIVDIGDECEALFRDKEHTTVSH